MSNQRHKTVFVLFRIRNLPAQADQWTSLKCSCRMELIKTSIHEQQIVLWWRTSGRELDEDNQKKMRASLPSFNLFHMLNVSYSGTIFVVPLLQVS